MSGKKRKMSEFDDAPVELDVGGTIFKAAPSTLCANSVYFSTLFRGPWNNDGPIFIDQDPEPFRELLSFMRKGCIPVEKLASVDVILLAVFLGMERLLEATKRRAYFNLHDGFQGSDDQAIEAFDKDYRTVSEAVSSGVLPDALLVDTTKRCRAMEYCTLDLLNKEFKKFVPVPPNEHPDMFTEFELVASVNNGSEQEDLTCGTFLDGLNWLSKHGYKTYEKNMEDTNVGHWVWRKLFFSRPVPEPTTELSMLIIDQTLDKDILPEKKYALLVPGLPNQSIDGEIKVDVGIQQQLAIARVPIGGMMEAPEQITSSISMESQRSVGHAMNWLHQEGYLDREADLEEIYNDMLAKTGDPCVGGQLQLYSKRI